MRPVEISPTGPTRDTLFPVCLPHGGCSGVRGIGSEAFEGLCLPYENPANGACRNWLGVLVYIVESQYINSKGPTLIL